MDNKLHIHFTGGNIEPGIIRSRELARVITAFEDAIASVVAQEHPGLRAEQIAVALEGVAQGSLLLEFAAPVGQPVYDAAHKLFSAIQNREWGSVPAASLRGTRKIREFAKRHDCVAQLSTTYGDTSVSAVLDEGTNIPASAVVYGETELIGEVARAGGVEPRVAFKTIQGQTLFCKTTRALAKELAHSLYEQIHVAGVATIDFETLDIMDFEITRLISSPVLPPLQAFGEIRQEFGAHFMGIQDVDEWVHQTRHGE